MLMNPYNCEQGAKFSAGDKLEISVTKILGRAIAIPPYKKNLSGKISIDVSGLKDGVYLLQLFSDKKCYAAKFVKSA